MTLDGIARTSPDFHLALGDFNYQNLPESAWCDYVKAHLGSTLPIELVAGNHEDDERENGHIDKFAACLPDRLGSVGNYGTEYYFDYHSLARIIMISPSLTVDGSYYYYGEDNSHFGWLSQAIDDARTAGIPWIIVGMHEPCLSIGEYYCPSFEPLMNLLIDKKVDLVLQGHDHTYQRTHQLGINSRCPFVTVDQFNGNCISHDGADNVYTKGEGPVFIVAGTAGGELYDLHPDKPQAGYFARSMGRNSNPTWGFVKYTVSRDQILASFVASAPVPGFSDAFAIKGAP